uniref:Ionotropic glutamate receptor C-terminal domain-containing protein n=1 Tax=Biomphalaria glabrata TaxID=6526 RepID=A0A2C9JPY9_BIOGL
MVRSYKNLNHFLFASEIVLSVMERAERLGLTREDYVWIFTLPAMKQAASRDTIKKTYPVGSFVIGFDSYASQVKELHNQVSKMWYSALKMMAISKEFESVDFQTHFSCNVQSQATNQSARSLYWKYGEHLYKYLLKTKFLNNQIGFDDKGYLKFNNFWIKNVQPRAESPNTEKVEQSTSKSTDSRGGRFPLKTSPFSSKRDIDFGFSKSRDIARESRFEGFTRKPLFRDRLSGPLTGPNDLDPDNPDNPEGTENRDLDLNDDPDASSGSSSYKNSSRKYPKKIGNSKMKPYGKNDVKRRYAEKHRRPRRQLSDKFSLNILQKVATWNGHNLTVTGIVWPGGASTPPKGKPEKYVLKVVTWAEDPHVIYTEKKNDTLKVDSSCDNNALPCTIYVRDDHLQRSGNQTLDVCCTGLSIDLLKRLCTMLNFDVQLTEVADGSYGSPINNNESDWTGMVGMLIHKKADMAIGALSITPERSNAVDFSMPFLQTGITIIVAIREGAISPTAFLEPYDYPSWSLILLFSVHATGASIFIFEWLSPYGLDQGKTSLRVIQIDFFESYILLNQFTKSLFLRDSPDITRGGCASRFLANIWALFAVVFCASYTANLAAFMITKDDYYDLSGIQDWRLKNPHHRQPPFKYATIANSSTDLNIAKNYKAIHSYMKNYPQTSVKDAIRALKNQEIQAFIYDSTTLEYEFGKDVGCKLKTVGKRIAETGYGLAFPKKSQWVKKVDKALLKLQEDGEIERLQKFWLAGACHKKKERGVSSHTLGILNFTSAFILLGGGVILGVLLLILEHMYFRFGRKSLKKWDKCGCCSLVSLSMGQSLTFEQSVIEAIDYHKHHKCKDPLCETQLWKVKHELDIALLKISQLRRLLAHSASLEVSREQRAPYKLEMQESTQVNGNAHKRRRQQKSDTASSGAEKNAAQPLLALEGKGDTDEEDGLLKPSVPLRTSSNPNNSPPHSVHIPLQSMHVSPHQADRSGPIYENKVAVGRDGSAQRTSPNQASKIRGDKNSMVADLELHPAPPTFDEAVLGYGDMADISPPTPGLPLPPPPHVPGSVETSPSSDGKRYEPFILDSPESPSSTFSEISDTNRLPSPGDLSKLSDEGQSSPASPSKDSNFTSSPDMRYPQGGVRGIRSMSPAYSNAPHSLQRLPAALNKNNANKDKTVSDKTQSQEDDNDVSARRLLDNDGNAYVNVDDIIGKETSF